MNIDDYRAMLEAERNQKDQPEAEKQEPKIEEPTAPVAPETPEEPKSEEPKVEAPKEVEIDGEKVPFDELRNGYLRQRDYTKKTQELSKKRKELEEAEKLYSDLKKNPQVAQELNKVVRTPEGLDPVASRIRELENKIYDMKLEQEIGRLQNQYKDFDVKEVLNVAHTKKLSDLEDAYKIWRSSKGGNEEVDVEKLKAELLEELKKEQNANKDTGTVISSKASKPVVESKEPKVSQAEQRIARGMGMSPDEYVKWRDMKK